MRDRWAVLELNSHGEIVAIDIERDLNVLQGQIRLGQLMKAPDLAPPELADE